MKSISREVLLFFDFFRNMIKRDFIVAGCLCIVIFVLGNSTSTYANENASINNTSEYIYNEIYINADKTGGYDATYDIQRVLNLAKFNATDYCRYKIIIPKGTYKLTRSLNIYSNTWLYLEEGTIMKRCFSEGCMLKNGVSSIPGYGYTSFKNIKLEGGTWDGQCFDEKYGYDNTVPFSSIRFGHASSIEMVNVSVINNKGGHHVELGGVDGVTIKNCYFEGYLETYLNDGTYVGKEAIQLDVLNSENLFLGYGVYDDSVVKNVVIENNTFKNISRGIGSHSAVVGKYYENIIIKNNVFKNLTQQAVIAFNFKNCNISNNIMDDVGEGIDFRYMTNDGSGYYMPNNLDENILIDDNAKTIIRNNKIITKKGKYNNHATGILLYGYDRATTNLNINNIARYNYRIKNVIIENNNISSEWFVINLNNAYNCIIRNNVLEFKNSKLSHSVIFLNESSNNQIQNNVIKGSVYGGMFLKNKSNSNKVAYNRINHIKDSGIRIYDNSTNNRIYNNDIGDAYNGIIIYNNSNASIINNKLYNNKNNGLVVSNTSFYNRINKNTFKSNVKNGIYFINVGKVSVNNNNLIDNYYNGIGLGEKTKSVRMAGNTCIGNKKRGIGSNSLPNINLDSIFIKSNKNGKIKISGKKNSFVYVKYGSKVIFTKKTSSKGEAEFLVGKKYKNKKLDIFIKDKYTNISKIYIYIK